MTMPDNNGDRVGKCSTPSVGSRSLSNVALPLGPAWLTPKAPLPVLQPLSTPLSALLVSHYLAITALMILVGYRLYLVELA